MPNSHPLHNSVYARLDAIASAEKITRVELAALSREALSYVMESHDIELVNRLIGVLTPVNGKVAILYFTNFLPWTVEEVDGKFARFGKMVKKPKQVKNKANLIIDWLSVDTNDLWVWAEENIEIEQKQVNLGDKLAKALTQALEGVDTDKAIGEAMTKADIMALIAKQITPDDMLEALTSLDEVILPSDVFQVAA